MTDPLVCNGQALDANAQPVGDTCGRPLPRLLQDADDPIDRARAAGWRIGPAADDGTRHVMCPRCGGPDPDLTRTLREITQGAADA